MKTRAASAWWRLAVALAVWLAACGGTAGPPLNAPPAVSAATPRPGPPAARLSGVVIDTDTGSPIESARIDVQSPALAEPRMALTDRAGRYDVGRLPAGLYTVTASAPAYMTATLGSRRLTGAQGTIPLADGERRDGIDLRLMREAVISGRVLDRDRGPLAGAEINALRPHLVDGQRRLASLGVARTDAQGRFRVAGLPPGDYYVSALPMVASGGEGTAPRYSPTYYPGSADAAGARRVRVPRGAEVRGVEFGVQLVPWARVAGSITSFDGKRLRNAAIIMQPHDAERVSPGPASGAQWFADGRFVFDRVPPGEYIIRALGQTDGDAPTLFAAFALKVEGLNVSNIALTLTPGAILSGRVRFDSHGTPPADLTRIRLYAPLTDGTRFGGEPKVRIRRDGTFRLDGVDAGARLIRAARVPAPWTLERVTQRGRDITDVPIDVLQGQVLSDVEIVFTDRAAWVAGSVQHGNGLAAVEQLVVVFPVDRALWRPFSRQIRSARTDWAGQYRIGPLPPGQYLLVAVSDLEETEIYERETLDQISPKAVAVALDADEPRRRDLRGDAPFSRSSDDRRNTAGGALTRPGGGESKSGSYVDQAERRLVRPTVTTRAR